MNPMVEFVILSAFTLLLFLLGAAFLLYHAHKQEKEYKARTNQK